MWVGPRTENESLCYLSADSCVDIPEMSEWKCLNLATISQGIFRGTKFRPQLFNLIVAAQIHLCPELYFEVSILFWHLVGWRRRLFAILPLENFSTFLSSFSFSSPDRRTKVAAAISTLFIQTWWQPPLLTCCFRRKKCLRLEQLLYCNLSAESSRKTQICLQCTVSFLLLRRKSSNKFPDSSSPQIRKNTKMHNFTQILRV